MLAAPEGVVQWCTYAEVAGEWKVRNSTGVNGVMDMYTAAEQSVNTYFVRLALDVGMCDVTEMAEKVGVESSTADAPRTPTSRRSTGSTGRWSNAPSPG